MKIKVKVGSLRFEQGTFKRGDIIEVTEERARMFEKLDVELLSGNTVVAAPVNVAVAPTVTVTKEAAPVIIETPKVVVAEVSKETVAEVVPEPAPAVNWGASKKTKTATVPKE